MAANMGLLSIIASMLLLGLALGITTYGDGGNRLVRRESPSTEDTNTPSAQWLERSPEKMEILPGSSTMLSDASKSEVGHNGTMGTGFALTSHNVHYHNSDNKLGHHQASVPLSTTGWQARYSSFNPSWGGDTSHGCIDEGSSQVCQTGDCGGCRQDPWWQADMQSIKTVAKVSIMNGPNHCSNRATCSTGCSACTCSASDAANQNCGFEVWVGNTACPAATANTHTTCNFKDTATLCGSRTGSTWEVGMFEIQCSSTLSGRYVMVSLPGSDRQIYLDEVTVYSQAVMASVLLVRGTNGLVKWSMNYDSSNFRFVDSSNYYFQFVNTAQAAGFLDGSFTQPVRMAQGSVGGWHNDGGLTLNKNGRITTPDLVTTFHANEATWEWDAEADEAVTEMVTLPKLTASKSHCMRRASCSNKLVCAKQSPSCVPAFSTLELCACKAKVGYGVPTVPYVDCTPWTACLLENIDHLYAEVFREVLRAAKGRQSSSLLQQRRVTSDPEGCIDLINLDLETLECDCWDDMSNICTQSGSVTLTEDELSNCIVGLMCDDDSNVCPSWKTALDDTGTPQCPAPSALLALHDTSKAEQELRVDPDLQNHAVTYEEMRQGLVNLNLTESELHAHWDSLPMAKEDVAGVADLMQGRRQSAWKLDREELDQSVSSKAACASAR